ncbi:MAG: hypothetical protein IKB98_09045 [Clostridia bacterium]|nr:hypothetical protein [Clostridia bacterium]
MKILIGSRYFFDCYEDFNGKDIDELELIDTAEFSQVRQITGQGRCLFQLKRHARTQEYIDWAVKSKIGMVVGKFLVPEFCQEIGFTINDLPKLQVLIDRLDDKHKYEEIIYNAYLYNGSFTLTQSQRDGAYQSYKESRRTECGLKVEK